ncbi:CCA tRNA nucleotidyltransferase 1, mitochondrial-like [Lineus longissimus]|uniref:CCA tRNA nucleotidyltransferase 1, mitochondrial-like n=1 Tax=Lineus longissimus TaxID=88925 RepID=UPI002B4CE051
MVGPLLHQLFRNWRQIGKSGCISCRNYSFDKKKVLGKLKTMKLNTPEFRSLFTPELKQLTELFKQYNYELRIAGGAVRDLLSGKPPNDIDFATTATPDQMMAMFNSEGIRMINAKGEKHGTITARINDKENFEVTTLRIDVETDGRHAEVEYTRDWQLDANRRDLTFNSMFLGFDGTVYDYFNGREDLEKRLVRFVGDADARIKEDYLRILRYFRFYGRIAVDGNKHEPKTLQAIRENAEGLKGTSGERIWMELKKIITGNHSPSIMRVMTELQLLKYFGLPSNPNIDELEIVWKRSRQMEPAPMTLISALLAEVKEVYTLQERIKMSTVELQTGIFIVRYRNEGDSSDLLNYSQELMIDTMGKEPKVKDRVTELLKYKGQLDVLEKFCEWSPPKFPIGGKHLVERGIKGGPKFAKILQELRMIWKRSGYKMSESELVDKIDEVRERIK